jgi:hypothetical protein
MPEAVLSPFATWQSFYVLVGTAAATLTGLLFVVITVNAGVRNRRTSDGIGAFGTPNVFHFGAVLLVAALLSAPWSILWMSALFLGLCGVGGLAYLLIGYGDFCEYDGRATIPQDWKIGCGTCSFRSSPTSHSSLRR